MTKSLDGVSRRPDPLSVPSPPRRWGLTNNVDREVWWITAERCSMYITTVELGPRAAALLLQEPLLAP